MRTSGIGQSTAAGSFANTADAPLVTGCDPAGTRYPSGLPLIDVASSPTIDVDRAGAARGSTFAAGALEGVP